MRVVHAGDARITTNGYAWSPLAGVIVEMDGASGGKLAFDASSVTAMTRDGKKVSASVMFVAAGAGIVTAAATGPLNTAGLSIMIGEKTFAAYASMITMAAMIEKGGGVEYTFKNGGKLEMGFLFRESAGDLATLSVTGHELALSPR